MYLWSIDIDAVLTAMSCFHLLCEKAEIRCGADEMAVTQLLPNYSVYSELATASTVLTTTGLNSYFSTNSYWARQSCHNGTLVYVRTCSVRTCMRLDVRLSTFFQPITSIFMDGFHNNLVGFQNNLAQLLFLTSRCAI